MARQILLKVDTSYSKTKIVAEVLEYLKSIGIAERDFIELALCCLYSPIAAANKGKTAREVQSRIDTSRKQFETQMSLALSQTANSDSSEDTAFNEDSDEIAEKDASSNLEDEKLSYINFDDEEF